MNTYATNPNSTTVSVDLVCALLLELFYIMNPFHYSSDGLQAHMQLKQTHHKWARYTLQYPTACPTRYEKNNTVLADYFQPLDAVGAPMVILFHGIGDQLLIPCKSLARSLVKKGVACLVLYSVFHSQRMPDEVKKRYPSLTPDEWFENYLISITDMRQAIDWVFEHQRHPCSTAKTRSPQPLRGRGGRFRAKPKLSSPP